MQASAVKTKISMVFDAKGRRTLDIEAPNSGYSAGRGTLSVRIIEMGELLFEISMWVQEETPKASSNEWKTRFFHEAVPGSAPIPSL